MKRGRVWTAVLLSALLLGLGGAGSVGAQAMPRVTIVVGGLEKIIYLPAMLTQRLGYFKEAGVDVSLLDEGAGVSAEDELIAGRLDGVVGFYDHTIDLQSKGKILEAVSIPGPGPGGALVVPHPSRIKTVRGL